MVINSINLRFDYCETHKFNLFQKLGLQVTCTMLGLRVEMNALKAYIESWTVSNIKNKERMIEANVSRGEDGCFYHNIYF